MTTHISTNVRYTCIALIVIMWCCIGCSNNSTGPAKSGNSLVKGTVQLLNDEYANPISDHSGIAVVLDNGVDVFKTTTSTDGSWQVANVPASVYTISASKTGFSGLVDGGIDTLTNVQYVGAGTFTAPPMRLAPEISPSMITEPVATAELKIRKDSNSHGVEYDTTLTLAIRARTKNLGKYRYNIFISERPDGDCGQAIFNIVSDLKPENGEVSVQFSWRAKSGELRKTFGNNLQGATYYVQLRPYFYKRTTQSGAVNVPCIQPAVAQFTL